MKTYRNMLDSNDALVDEFLSRGRHKCEVTVHSMDSNSEVKKSWN